jgi:hypothetical protein
MIELHYVPRKGLPAIQTGAFAQGAEQLHVRRSYAVPLDARSLLPGRAFIRAREERYGADVAAIERRVCPNAMTVCADDVAFGDLGFEPGPRHEHRP